MKRSLVSLCYVMIALFASTLSGSGALAETHQGGSIESRIMLGLDVPAEKLAAAYPEGWMPMALPSGPLAGSTLMITFIDTLNARDAEGKYAPTGVNRRASLLGLGVKKGEKPRIFVLKSYEPETAQDPYGVAVGAQVSRTTARDAGNGAAPMIKESWSVTASDGDAMQFTVTYAAGGSMWLAEQVAMPFSAANPDFHRIYRYDQVIDIVMLSAKGKMPAGGYSLSGEGPVLGGVLGDAGTPVAIMAIPVYLREVYLP